LAALRATVVAVPPATPATAVWPVPPATPVWPVPLATAVWRMPPASPDGATPVAGPIDGIRTTTGDASSSAIRGRQAMPNLGDDAAGEAANDPAIQERLAVLVARHQLPEGSAGRLSSLLDLLASDPTAPTSVRDPGPALDIHLADSLVALQLEEVRSAAAIADVGSGAGLPGLPLAIALPRAEVDLIESNRRKCEFIRRAAKLTATDNARVIDARAETWPAGLGRFDVVTARAVAPLTVLAEYAAPLLRLGGVLVAWRGRRDPQGEGAAERAAAQLGLQLWEPVPVQPYDGAEHRHLHLMSKVRETPNSFPRRAGMALKRPLGTGTASPV
jgi:16S rRNA (guanine527-N7)-methyltransferase